MGSLQGQVSAALTSLGTLEAKVDSLAHKLELVLGRGGHGGCPVCVTCGVHARQQEAKERQLVAQSRLLEKMEQRIAEMQAALERMEKGGLEGKHVYTNQQTSQHMNVVLQSQPQAAATPKTASLPAKTPLITVNKSPDGCSQPESSKQQYIKPQPPAISPQKGGHEGKHVYTNTQTSQHVNVVLQPQPQAAANPKTALLPAKSPLIIVKSPDGFSQSENSKQQYIKSQPPAISPQKVGCGEEQRDPKGVTVGQKPIVGRTPVDHPHPAADSSAQKAHGTLVAAKDMNRQQAVHNAPVKGQVTMPGVQVIGGHSQEVKGQPMARPSRQCVGGTDVTQAIPDTMSTSVIRKSDVHSEPQVREQRPPCKQAAAVAAPFNGEEGQARGRARSVPGAGWKSQEVKVQSSTTGLSAGRKEKSGAAMMTEGAAAAGQSVAGGGQPGQSATGPIKTAKTVTLLQVPQKPCGLAVPTVTTESLSPLRHVSSCPESLQRLQGAGLQAPVQKVVPTKHPAQGNSHAVVARRSGPSPGPDCGIQIHVIPTTSSSSSDTARRMSSPQICHKIIDDVPPQPAPFLHRFVSLSSSPASDLFTVHTREVLGGGRFGKVHRCTERSSGLRLAAKVINTRNAKEKEMAVNEVQVMNQLSHGNILQLYEAFESRNQVVLILEYVEGGELFDRIVDESTPLTEVDAMVFVKQICEGLHYMHQMYVLHLDLKPENILCVNHTGHQVKIIDFGLARRYKPREKLRVNFGTPEFLAPEVVNFDSVSFPTDMWTLGVVTYMLVSGMSPFLGDDDSQTLSNVLAVNWYFDDEAFEHVSAEAKDFIANLLIREKGGRLSAAQCLKHPWLNNISEKAKHNNIVLKSQVLLKKYMAKRLWKKNYIAIAAANRLKKISSSGSLTSMGV